MDTLRGHKIINIDGNWHYADTGQYCPNNKNRACGHCGKDNTPEGHDACLGTLPLAMNACCGHGLKSDAYIQFWGGTRLSGRLAQIVFWILKRKRELF